MKNATRHSVRNVFSKHSGKHRNAPARSAMEVLESRRLLSGSVLASVVHGMLTIRGDNAANAIVMDQTGLNASQVRVSAGNATTINNQANPVILSGVIHGARIRMGNAADSVTLNNISFRGNVSVDGGKGANILTLNTVHVAESLLIQNGSKLSTIAVADTAVGKRLSIQGGSGGQNVTLRSVQVRSDAAIVSGVKGPVILAIDDSTFDSAVAIRTGNRADTIQLDARGASQGPPTVFHGPLTIATNGGNDTLEVGLPMQSGNRDVFSGKVNFDGGTGFDTLRNFDTAANSGKRFQIKHFESRITDSITIAPTVSSTNPSNTRDWRGRLNRKIAATFSTAMDPSTITTANVTVTAPGHAAVAGTVAYVGTTMTFTPSSPLTANTVFTLTISARRQGPGWNFTGRQLRLQLHDRCDRGYHRPHRDLNDSGRQRYWRRAEPEDRGDLQRSDGPVDHHRCQCHRNRARPGGCSRCRGIRGHNSDVHANERAVGKYRLHVEDHHRC